jgi:secreted trypsin-like serine protease
MYDMNLLYRSFHEFFIAGGGFFVKVGKLWAMRGIVSASLKNNFGECDVESYTIYTKVVNFSYWIKSIVYQNCVRKCVRK